MKAKVEKGRNSELISYYRKFDEKNRLSQGIGQLEFMRTQEIISRYLTPLPAVVYDVGGAAGAYSCWLAKLGYEVHLRDPVPSHVEEAIRASRAQADCPIASCRVGDARFVDFSDESADALLFLGPMYHLPERGERLQALCEAHRVLRQGGVIFVATISRFASILDGFFRSFLNDPTFVAIVKGDLTDGQHKNPTGNPEYFTEAFFHRPLELKQEMEEAGFLCEKILPVEGIGVLLPDF